MPREFHLMTSWGKSEGRSDPAHAFSWAVRDLERARMWFVYFAIVLLLQLFLVHQLSVGDNTLSRLQLALIASLGGAVTMCPLVVAIRLLPDRGDINALSAFGHVLEKLSKLIEIPVSELRHFQRVELTTRTKIALSSLAAQVVQLEKMVGKVPLKKDEFVVQNARCHFQFAHDVAFALGLAEKDWGRYFPKQDKDAEPAPVA